MNLSGNRVIVADRMTVWNALNDPEVLKASIPGCQELTGSVEEGYAATVTQKVGPVKATFKGHVTLSDIVVGESYTISGEGKGGAAGFAKGAARVSLVDSDDGGTELAYEVDAKVGGKLAQLGSRIIDGFAKKMADQFFTNFQTAVDGPLGEPEDAAADAAVPTDDAVPDDGKKKGWLGRLGLKKA
jgi:carbon monoxide dehydrogenase subunit G